MKTGTIRVGNKRVGSPEGPEPGETFVNIDRGTPLGNPHRTRTGLSRKRVIELYRQDFEADRQAGGPLWRATLEIVDKIKQGEDVVLLCWCKPLPCHGDVIKAAVEQQLKSDEPQTT